MTSTSQLRFGLTGRGPWPIRQFEDNEVLVCPRDQQATGEGDCSGDCHGLRPPALEGWRRVEATASPAISRVQDHWHGPACNRSADPAGPPAPNAAVIRTRAGPTGSTETWWPATPGARRQGIGAAVAMV